MGHRRVVALAPGAVGPSKRWPSAAYAALTRRLLAEGLAVWVLGARAAAFLRWVTASVLFEMFLAVPYYFAFGDEPKLVENSTLAVMFLSGLFGAVLSASSSLARVPAG